MEKLIKEQLVLIVIVLVVIVGGIAGAYNTWTKFSETSSEKTNKENELKVQQEEYEKLLADAKKLEQPQEVKEEKKQSGVSGKRIPEVPGQQFSPEASFGNVFENLLANITNSGVKVRAIKYNYEPQDDKIALAGSNAGYNACELSFVTVGTYAQFQNFFKSVARDPYLSSIYEIYIEPYDNDKTILITKFKVRLYTRTI